MSEYKKIENAKAELTCTLDGDAWAKAKEAAMRLDSIFGHGNFFLELQDHGIPQQRTVRSHRIPGSPSMSPWGSYTPDRTAENR